MKTFTDLDKYFMKCALTLAEKEKGNTYPNPSVGAVIVKNGKIVGSGATSPYGGPHAEKKAIQRAGINTEGATLYVTLEPCHHYGKTPPCTNAIFQSKIQRIFVAIKDPFPLVNGKGIQYLRRKNIEVSVGLMKNEAFALNEDYFWSVQHQIPWVTLKLALTLDGKLADSNGNSQWITNKKSRNYVHQLRKYHSAVAVGSGTLVNDNPRLTVRHIKGKSPIRIVFSSDSNVGRNSNFRTSANEVKSILICNKGKQGTKEITSDGLEIWYTGNNSISENLNTFLKMAYKYGLNSILVEGGQKLATSFLEHKLVNKICFFYGNKILGSGMNCLQLSHPLSMVQNIILEKIEITQFDDNVCISGIPKWTA